jgi:hypothetical protein
MDWVMEEEMVYNFCVCITCGASSVVYLLESLEVFVQRDVRDFEV